MDIVIPLGEGSTWNDNELRYCLRSIESNCFDHSQIYIIGVLPSWIRNVVHIPFEEKRRKEINIWDKVLAASRDERISGDFFFCNDDFFFLKAFRCSGYPYYHKGDIGASEVLKNDLKNSYFQIVRNTHQLLNGHQLPTLHFDIHRPMIINKARFQEVYEFFSPELNDDRELIMKSCYCNYNLLSGPKISDLKVGKHHENELAHHLRAADMFSIYNSLIGKKFLDFINIRFPEKSKFEE